MCLILLATGASARYPLIVAANRDEAYDRPAAPAGYWADHPPVFAGRDLEQGGTWLGITTGGRFAAVTNYRQRPATIAPRSRGELTREFLVRDVEPRAYLGEVEARRNEFRGFSLIVGDVGELHFYSNRGGIAFAVTPGVHGLSNHLLDEPWPKVRRGIAVLSGLLDAPEHTVVGELFGMLADRTHAPDRLLPATGIPFERERDLSPAFIAADQYGTRASTVILVRSDGEVSFAERRFGPGGVALGTTEQRFRCESRPTSRGQVSTRA